MSSGSVLQEADEVKLILSSLIILSRKSKKNVVEFLEQRLSELVMSKHLALST